MSDKDQLTKENMRKFLEHLGKGRTLVGPVDTGKVIEYREAAASDILMDDRVSYNSIKAYYFPQTELMFTFDNEEVEDNNNIQGYVIFGARPCDLDALKVMSVVYTTGKYTDPFFQRRFEANLLIGVGCINEKPECFCREMGVDKEFSDFCDIMLKDCGDYYTAEYMSDKGNVAFQGYLKLLDKNPSSVKHQQINTQCNNTEEPRPCFPPPCIKTNEPSPCLTAPLCLDKTEEPSPCPPCPLNEPSPQPPSRLVLDTEKDDVDYFDIIDWGKPLKHAKAAESVRIYVRLAIVLILRMFLKRVRQNDINVGIAVCTLSLHCMLQGITRVNTVMSVTGKEYCTSISMFPPTSMVVLPVQAAADACGVVRWG